MIILFFIVRKYIDLTIKYKAARYKTEYNAIQPFWPSDTREFVTIVTTSASTNDNSARNRKIKPRALANCLPTELFFSQCGHLASWLTNELNRNVSPQWPQLTLHIPGTGEMSLVLGLFFAGGVYKTIIFRHDVRGQEILCAVDLQMSKQLHWQRIYFWPGGGSLIGYCNDIVAT